MKRRPILFLLDPDSRPDRPDGWYCPDCAIVEGALTYYPQLREAIEIRRIAYPRPRRAIVELIGDEFQDCPLLLVDPEIGPAGAPRRNGWSVVTLNTRLLLDTLSLLAPGVSRPGNGSLFRD